MNGQRLKPSELKLLFRNDDVKYYRWICFLKNGKFLLESTINKQEVIGKILTSSSEGELHIWPQLQHENINRLLEVLCLSDHVKILISPLVGRSIGTLIYDESFNESLLCFDRKKSYAKGILSALTYMHQNSVFHLNLNDENVAICSRTDKAVLCDFSHAVSRREVPRSLLPPKRHLAPEVYNGIFNDFFDVQPMDIWDCGILLLQIFTQHQCPWQGAVRESLEILDMEILKKTNTGANLRKEVVGEFRIFIQHLLSEDPELRPSAEEALKSCFLQKTNGRLDGKTRRFWGIGKISDSRIEMHNFIDDKNICKAIIQPGFGCRKSDKARLTWTKSEPDGKYYQEDANPTLPGYVSSPSLQQNMDVQNADLRKENGHGSCLPKWIADTPLNMEKDLSYLLYPKSEEIKEEFSQYPTCSLERMIPYIISMSDFNLDGTPQISYNPPSKSSKESHSNPNISKVGTDEWIDIPLQNSHNSSLFKLNMEMDEKMAKEKIVYSKKRPELLTQKSTSKGSKRTESPKIIDKRNLYKKSEANMAADVESCFEGTRVPQRKKWYHKLCPGSNTKRAR